MASVQHRTNDAGDHAIGVVVGGTFVPFVKLTAAKMKLMSGDAAPSNTFNSPSSKPKES